MCGISGYLLKKEPHDFNQTINCLLDPIRKRGPDDEGIALISRSDNKFQSYRTNKTINQLNNSLPNIFDNSHHVKHDIALIHSRYAIIDLSEKGHQPFISSDKSVVAIFNGEIYNYLELKEQLTSIGVNFRTTSDTEVLVEGYHIWKNELWNKLNGFWAVALYDFNENKLIFSRDRIGVAPLYYRQTENGLYFSSYIQPLINVSGNNRNLNNDAILGFVQTGIKDHDCSTFYSDIKSMPSFSTVTFNINTVQFNEASLKQYWNFPNTRLDESDISLKTAINQYRDTFFDAVNIRLRADVKVAFELSGGLFF